MGDPSQQMTDEELSTLLHAIDHAPPVLRVERVMMLSRRRQMRRGALIAAATVVLAASVATAAVPGFSVPALLRLTFTRDTPPLSSHAHPQAQSADVSVARGIAFVPAHEVRIEFAADQVLGSVRVRLTKEASLKVTQASSDRDARFALTPDGVSVSNAGSTASYEILIPATLARAYIELAGRPVYAKVGTQLKCKGTLDAERSCLISMPRPSSDRTSPR